MLDGRCLISVITVTGLTDTILVCRGNSLAPLWCLLLKCFLAHTLTCLQPKHDWRGGRHISCSYTWIAGPVDPLLCEQQRMDWIWVPWNLNPHFKKIKLVGFSAYCQNKIKFSATLENVFCNATRLSFLFWNVNSWTCWSLIMWATKNRLDLSTLEFNPPFIYPN